MSLASIKKDLLCLFLIMQMYKVIRAPTGKLGSKIRIPKLHIKHFYKMQ